MKTRALALLVFMVVPLACRNLDLPKQDGGTSANAGPEIAFNTPHAGDHVALSQFFSLNVEDVNGVREVKLSCGGHELQAWTGPGPLYQAAINLGACRQGVPLSITDAGTFQFITLNASASDKLDAGSMAQLQVTLDVNIASVVVEVPPRVAPGARLTIAVRSDQDLVAPPQVLVDGAPVTTASTDGGTRSFVASLTAPELGVGRYTDGGTPNPDGGDVPLEVLGEIERQLPVTVDATSSSGFTTHQEARVLLSRIAWQVTVPGQVMADVLPPQALPVAFAEGIQVPINANDSDQYGPVWVPVFFDAADGAASPYPGPTGFSTKLGGFRPLAFDALGRTLLVDPRKATAFTDARNGQVLTLDSKPFSGALQFARVRSSLCSEQVTGAYCSGSTSRAVKCLNADGTLVSITVSTADKSSQLSQLNMGTGSVYVGANASVDTCYTSPAQLVVASLGPSVPALPFPQDGGTATKDAGIDIEDAGTDTVDAGLVPLDAGTDVEDAGPLPNIPDGGTVNFGDVLRMLPVGDGTFVVIPTSGTPVQLLDSTGKAIGSYFKSTAQPSGGQLIAALPNHAVVVVSPQLASPYTIFETYPSTGGPPSPAKRLFGLPQTVSDAGSPLPQNTVTNSNSDLAVLLKYTDHSYAVAVFDHDMNPRWLYRHPLYIDTTAPQLVGDGRSHRLYFIDRTNSVVVAFVW